MGFACELGQRINLALGFVTPRGRLYVPHSSMFTGNAVIAAATAAAPNHVPRIRQPQHP